MLAGNLLMLSNTCLCLIASFGALCFMGPWGFDTRRVFERETLQGSKRRVFDLTKGRYFFIQYK